MQTKIRTEGLPEIFLKESVEKYELRISKKGTELVIGVDKENNKVFIFCRGIHKSRYKINYRKPDGTIEELEAQPFEGVVELTPSAFSELYFVVVGIERESGEVGNDITAKVRAKFNGETKKLQFIFSDYRKKRRTIVGFGYAKLIILQALFERIKSVLPFLRTVHVENGKTLIMEYDRVMNNLTLITNRGDVEISSKTLPILKTLLQKILINGISLDRPFVLSGFSLRPDGSVSLAGDFYEEKVSYLLGGEEKQLPAVSLKIFQLIS